MNKWLIFILVFLVSTAGCNGLIPAKTDPGAIYTAAAGTVRVELTREAALTPTLTPTSVPTLTPTPTLSSTPSPVPSTTPIPSPTWAFHKPGNVLAPVLRYTFIGQGVQKNSSYEYDPKLDVSTQEFEEHLQSMKKANITPITMSVLEEAIRNGADLPHQPVAIIFVGDADGIYRNALPLMKQVGFPATVYVLASHVDQPGMLSATQLKEMAAVGWEIGSQGVNGYNLTGHHDQLKQEIDGARQTLEEKLGVKIVSFAYPMGGVDDTVAGYVANSGFKGALGRMVSMEHTPATLFFMGSLGVKAGQTGEQLINTLPYH